MRAWPGFVLPLLLGACAHDFSKFVLPPDDDDGGESGDGLRAIRVDATAICQNPRRPLHR